MTYSDKLKNPLWQKKRLRIFERDDWTCFCCGRQTETLHVHHLFYLPDLNPWEYDDNFLITYCEYCHNTEHLIGNDLDDCLVELIRSKPLFITAVARLCILIEKHPPFLKNIKEFLNSEMVSYLESRKTVMNG